MKLPLKTVSMKFMLFIAISSLFLSPASAEVLEVRPTPIEASESGGIVSKTIQFITNLFQSDEERQLREAVIELIEVIDSEEFRELKLGNYHPTEAYDIEVKKLAEELLEIMGGEELSELDEKRRLMVSDKIIGFLTSDDNMFGQPQKCLPLL